MLFTSILLKLSTPLVMSN